MKNPRYIYVAQGVTEAGLYELVDGSDPSITAKMPAPDPDAPRYRLMLKGNIGRIKDIAGKLNRAEQPLPLLTVTYTPDPEAQPTGEVPALPDRDREREAQGSKKKQIPVPPNPFRSSCGCAAGRAARLEARKDELADLFAPRGPGEKPNYFANVSQDLQRAILYIVDGEEARR